MSTYEDFRKQICAGIHMGLSGIPWWTTDIGGFHGGWVDKPTRLERSGNGLVQTMKSGAMVKRIMRL